MPLLTGLLPFAGVLVATVVVLAVRLLQPEQHRPTRSASVQPGVPARADKTTVAAQQQSAGDVLDRRRL